MSIPLNIRRDPECDWESRNPTLDDNEIGVVVRGGRAIKAKLGPGKWNDLDFILDTTTSLPEFVVGEELGGVIDGANATFTTEFNFVPTSVSVSLNGIVQKKPTDFNTTGTRTVLFMISPEVGDIILVSYLRS